PCDLARLDEVEGLPARVEAALGPVDLLINNAGVDDFQHFERSDPADIARQVQLNLIAPLVLTRLVLPGMLDRGQGHVLSMASTAGLVGTPYGATYSAAKAGVIAMTNSLCMEFADAPVGFSALCPGFVNGAGMHEAHKAAVGDSPALLGGTTVDAVVDAAVRIIRDGAPERIVNSAPLRPLIGLGRAIPPLANRLTRMLSGQYMQALADHRGGGAG
ncbi:MAG: SDR family NAD(P)-dependent oxidoreductase, partial [Deltaproteobacteria bacterium]